MQAGTKGHEHAAIASRRNDEHGECKLDLGEQRHVQIPDEEARILRVRLHGMANPRSTRVLAGFCRLLNELPGYQTHFPGTRLRIVLEAPSVAQQSS